MSELHTQNTCAVHDILMNSLQDQITNIENGQKEVKDLIVSSSKESIKHTRMYAEESKQAIDKLADRLDDEITKFHERDREYILALNDMRIETNNSLNLLKAKHMALTMGGIAIAGTVTFLLNLFRVANQIIDVVPVIH